ncbi:MAG: C40 family peptidase [Parachlamydiales bacterium]|nr:C40 family peptidase [Parachlamydiales bacterium]
MSAVQASRFADHHLGTVQIGKREYPVCSPQKSGGSAMFQVYGSILSDVLTRIGDTALQKIKSTRPSQRGFGFAIRTPLIHRAINEWKDVPTEGKVDKEKMTEVTAITGLSQQNVAMVVAIAKKWATEYFSKDYIFSYDKNDIENWKKETVAEANNFLYSKLKMKQSEAPVSFAGEDLAAWGLAERDVTADPATINCLSFALLKAKVIQAANLVFKTVRDDSAMHQIFQRLNQWGYEPVRQPNAGDLVVYLDRNNKATHVGVYMGEDLVHSKIGIANPYSHEHALFAVEERAIFFHKKG